MPTPDVAPTPFAHPVRTVLILAFATAIGLGMGRFAYALVLPDMRDSLGWSYATAGSMNTINAVGYLAGALLGAPVVRMLGLSKTIAIGTLIGVVSLVFCALTGEVVPFATARFVSGAGAGIAQVAGGALAASIAQSRPAQSALLIGLFYTGPAFGIIISGSVAPFLLQAFGAGSWWIVWSALAGIALVMAVPLALSLPRGFTMATTDQSTAAPLRPILLYLTGYFLYGAGYIAYMTFMIAYVRDAGGAAFAQSAFWVLIGVGGYISPWLWRPLIARGQSGMAMALMIGLTGVGAALALISTSPTMLAVSAFVFGAAFLAVTIATTAFARFNYPPAAWPKVIAIITVAFGLGQILGPIAIGAITDALGSLSYALNISAAMLTLGAIISAFQRPLRD
jgi:predicted MFS family arabinose efflux permease